MRRKDRSILRDTDGTAVVEATFVLPMMFMVFFALVLLALYLPQRAMLQRATQFAANAIATELSDTWIYYDSDTQAFGRYSDHEELRDGKGGVYVALYNAVLGSGDTVADGAQSIVEAIDDEENIPVIANGELTFDCRVVNYVVYKEIVVTATRSIKVPVDFSAIRFPSAIDMTVTSKAVVQNGDEFVRSLDLAADFVGYVQRKYPAVDNIFNAVAEAGNKINGFFGI
jgi:Flp pilus assembly protein TadG